MGKLRMIFVFLSIGILLSGCAATQQQSSFQPADLNSELSAGNFIQKTDAFLMILDASATMGEADQNQTKWLTAKQFAESFSRTVPALKLDAGLSVFGGGFNRPAMVYGMTGYSQSDFSKAMEVLIEAIGDSPLDAAIAASGKALGAVSGRIALIVVSDGKDMDSAPVSAAAALKSSFGDRLCIYTVLVGDDPEGKAVLDQVASAGKCGFASKAGNLTSPAAMADFVRKIFFDVAPKPMDSDGDGVTDDKDQCPDTPKGVKVDAKGCPLDTDGDGVPDYLDSCPDTPAGMEVDKWGCPLDSDGDGVTDDKDQCPDTPRGAKVNARGCWILADVNFNTDKTDISSAFAAELDGVVDVLKSNPSLRLEVAGHTDSVGDAGYNQGLSERRAKVVMDYLIGKGIDAGRLTGKGLGETEPIASNDTKAGRAENRRVELKPIQ